MSYQLYCSVSFGGSKAGLLTVGYSLYTSAGSPSGSRITAGVQALSDGQYAALVTFPDNFRGRLSWDTGEGSPIYVHDTINPEDGEYTIILPTLAPTTGDGSVEVDHDYGGADALQYVDGDDIGIDNAIVRVYLATDYTAGNKSQAYVVAQTTTNVEGRWNFPLMLDPADYTIMFYKQGEFGPDTVDLTVT
jgi:hypothetical protein